MEPTLASEILGTGADESSPIDEGIDLKWLEYALYSMGLAEADDKDDNQHCPTLAEHLADFEAKTLCEFSVNSIRRRFNANLVPTFPYWNYGDYVLVHPDFAHSHGNPRSRLIGVLFIKYVFDGKKTRTHHAVIRFDYRCRFCHHVGNWVDPGIRRTPCLDPFIEARDRRTDFDFPGVVAFVNLKTKVIIRRKYWCWSTLKGEREVVAVYSKKTRHNSIKRGWIYLKLNRFYNRKEVRWVLYIEDLLALGYKERIVKPGAEIEIDGGEGEDEDEKYSDGEEGQISENKISPEDILNSLKIKDDEETRSEYFHNEPEKDRQGILGDSFEESTMSEKVLQIPATIVEE